MGLGTFLWKQASFEDSPQQCPPFREVILKGRHVISK